MTPLLSVTAADALDDGDWFGTNPQRRYRVRPARDGVWIVRRRGRVLLRTFTAAIPGEPPVAERGIETLWYATAWPDLSPERRADISKASRQRIGGKRR